MPYREKVKITCIVCKKVCYRNKCSPAHGPIVTCGRKCQYVLISKRAADKNRGRRKPSHWKTVVCPVCKKSRTVKKSNPSLHCSKKCAHASPDFKRRISESLRNSVRLKSGLAARTAKLKKDRNTPEWRAAASQRTKSQWNDPVKAQRLRAGIMIRSMLPKWYGAPHFQRGAAHPRYKGNKSARQIGRSRYEYKQWRLAVFKRDNYTCQKCGKRGGYLHAHHKKPWADFPELRYVVSNGKTLCKGCHEELDEALSFSVHRP